MSALHCKEGREDITAAHGARTLCRTLATIHMAPALTLGTEEFATLDQR